MNEAASFGISPFTSRFVLNCNMPYQDVVFYGASFRCLDTERNLNAACFD